MTTTMPWWNARREPTPAEWAANQKAQQTAKEKAQTRRARKRAAWSAFCDAREAG